MSDDEVVDFKAEKEARARLLRLAELTKVTVNLVPKSVEAMDAAAQRCGDTPHRHHQPGAADLQPAHRGARHRRGHAAEHRRRQRNHRGYLGEPRAADVSAYTLRQRLRRVLQDETLVDVALEEIGDWLLGESLKSEGASAPVILTAPAATLGAAHPRTTDEERRMDGIGHR